MTPRLRAELNSARSMPIEPLTVEAVLPECSKARLKRSISPVVIDATLAERRRSPRNSTKAETVERYFAKLEGATLRVRPANHSSSQYRAKFWPFNSSWIESRSSALKSFRVSSMVSAVLVNSSIVFWIWVALTVFSSWRSAKRTARSQRSATASAVFSLVCLVEIQIRSPAMPLSRACQNGDLPGCSGLSIYACHL